MKTKLYCEKCGNELEWKFKFCTMCGSPIVQKVLPPKIELPEPEYTTEWRYRLMKVIYIIGYFPLIILVIIVRSANSTDYNREYQYTTDTPWAAFLYSLLAIAIYVIVIRLIKIAVLYVVVAKKPDWQWEFKKLY